MPGSMVKIDARDYVKFSRQIRKASKDIGPKLRKAEKKGAEIIADRAREIVEPHSKKAAETVRAFTVGALSGVQTGSRDEPLGVLLEVGNASSSAEILRSYRTGGFRHPVYPTGDRSTWHWNNEHPQKMWPHLGPAANQKTDECLAETLRGVNEALLESNIRFKFE